MKKNLLLILMVLFAAPLLAQDTLTGWTFPTKTGPDSLNANLGTTQNKSYDLRFQWVLTATTDSTLNTITFVDGATSYAAATTGWDNGADVKFWSIKFKANNYTSFRVSSKQKSDDVNPGPRDFKLQWRLSSTTYADVAGGTITLAADWTTGAVDNLPVPITGQGTSSIYIRWIMASNIDINGGTVTPAGQSMIDDILVTALNSAGQNEIVYTDRLKIFPSPNHGTFTLTSTVPMETLSITDLNGKNLVSISRPSQNQAIRMPAATPGMYFLKVRFEGSDQEATSRFIIE